MKIEKNALIHFLEPCLREFLQFLTHPIVQSTNCASILWHNLEERATLLDQFPGIHPIRLECSPIVIEFWHCTTIYRIYLTIYLRVKDLL